MTEFEFIDARSSIVQNILTGFSVWVSVSFAIMVAGFYASPELGVLGNAAIILLYSLACMTNVALQSRNFRVFLALVDDAASYCEKHPGSSTAVSYIASSRSLSSFFGALVLIGVTSLVAIAYVVGRGFLGW